jgi:hypothetical protein
MPGIFLSRLRLRLVVAVVVARSYINDADDQLLALGKGSQAGRGPQRTGQAGGSHGSQQIAARWIADITRHLVLPEL